MKKVKYYYDIHTLRYEKLESSLWRKVRGALFFLFSAILLALGFAYFSLEFMDSPLKQEIASMELQYELMNEKMEQMDAVLGDLQGRDDKIYRTIFEAEPIPSNVREGFSGGVDKYKNLQRFRSKKLMTETAQQMDRIRRKLYIQSKSYDEISNMIKNKESMLAAIPAIQPVANKDLKRMASGFHYRIDPIYKIRKFHYGIDFSAPRGTDIYSTGNGKVVKVKYSRTGYGHHVIVDHGFGYQTLYGHMSKINVSEGQEVTRGDVLGLVGSTGKSVAPHLHYEVIKDGVKINPINFFYDDLTPDEFEEMLELASTNNQSLD
jgi:murein DD-endopeptidase MepM/ murein hydrolase activator NlpD